MKMTFGQLLFTWNRKYAYSKLNEETDLGMSWKWKTIWKLVFRKDPLWKENKIFNDRLTDYKTRRRSNKNKLGLHFTYNAYNNAFCL